VLQDEGLVDNAARMGALIKALFAERMEDGLPIKQIRGRGLLLAVQFADDVPAKRGWSSTPWATTACGSPPHW